MSCGLFAAGGRGEAVKKMDAILRSNSKYLKNKEKVRCKVFTEVILVTFELRLLEELISNLILCTGIRDRCCRLRHPGSLSDRWIVTWDSKKCGRIPGGLDVINDTPSRPVSAGYLLQEAEGMINRRFYGFGVKGTLLSQRPE